MLSWRLACLRPEGKGAGLLRLVAFLPGVIADLPVQLQGIPALDAVVRHVMGSVMELAGRHVFFAAGGPTGAGW